MTDSAIFDGKEYISSKRAAHLSDYAQDYIGQLARKGLIDARRVGGLWYVFMDSLTAYKTKSENYKPQPPHRERELAPESMITFDGKQYVSAARAAKNSGYHQDYVGQLARSGKIASRQIGNRWYVDNEQLEAHKQEKDSLLAAVQSQSVGIGQFNTESDDPDSNDRAFFTYSAEEDRDLLPVTASATSEEAGMEESVGAYDREYAGNRIAIHVRTSEPVVSPHPPRLHVLPVRHSKSRISQGYAAAALFTIVIVLSTGFLSLKSGSFYAVRQSAGQLASLGSIQNVLQGLSDWIENFFTQTLEYKRPSN